MGPALWFSRFYLGSGDLGMVWEFGIVGLFVIFFGGLVAASTSAGTGENHARLLCEQAGRVWENGSCGKEETREQERDLRFDRY